jgi:hypothetical protein
MKANGNSLIHPLRKRVHVLPPAGIPLRYASGTMSRAVSPLAVTMIETQ